MSADSMASVEASVETSIKSESPAPDVDAPAQKVAKRTGSADGPGTQQRTSKLGRKGDPRMHRAVAARLADPDLSLLEALRAGGFEFPECDEKGGTLDGTIVDSDNVQLCQRKNQLSRRLRLARQSKNRHYIGADDGKGAGGSKPNKKRIKHDFGALDGDVNELSVEAEDRIRQLIQQTQQRGKASSKKRKNSGGADEQNRKHKTYKTLLSLSADDEVEVVEEDPYEDEMGSDSSARRAKNHPLFQQRQPAIPTAAWGAAAHLGLAGMAAAGAAAAAAGAVPPGQTTAAQQLQQAAAAYGAASANTAAGAALAMAQARGAVPVAAQHSFSFWPSLAAASGGAAAAAAAQAQAVHAQHFFQQQQQAQAKQQNADRSGKDGSSAAAKEHNANSETKSVGGAASAPPSDAHSPSLALTAASLGMSQGQLAAVLGGSGQLAGAVLPQQQGALQTPQQLQMAQSLATSVGAAATGNGADTQSTSSSTSARDQVTTAFRQAVNGAAPAASALDNDGKMAMALDLLRTESAALLKRCMLMSGFEASQTEECDWHYLKFAERAAEEERKRLARLRARIGPSSDSKKDEEGKYVGNSASGGHDDHKKSEKHVPSDKPEKSSSQNTGTDERKHDNSSESQGVCFDGRHVHRLKGECGHQAVIHQPEGGQPHVDFVVDNKIECYGGIPGCRRVGSSQALWPSKFSCDQLMCDKKKDSHEVTCGPQACTKECEDLTKTEPKIFDLNEIEFDGKEWTKDLVGDDTLLGLITLGDETHV